MENGKSKKRFTIFRFLHISAYLWKMDNGKIRNYHFPFSTFHFPLPSGSARQARCRRDQNAQIFGVNLVKLLYRQGVLT